MWPVPLAVLEMEKEKQSQRGKTKTTERSILLDLLQPQGRQATQEVKVSPSHLTNEPDSLLR